MDEQFASLRATDDQESSIELFMKYEAVALPVVDKRNVLVGIVTVDDVIEVAEEEGTEDFQMMAGMGALESSYFSTGFWAMLGKRLPWLAMLLCAETLTTVALLGFDKLPLFAVLVVFVPLINSPAGNAGTQMAGLMIRGLAVAEVELKDWSRVLVRELTNGVTLGIALGILGFVAARIFSAFVEEPDRRRAREPGARGDVGGDGDHGGGNGRRTSSDRCCRSSSSGWAWTRPSRAGLSSRR